MTAHHVGDRAAGGWELGGVGMAPSRVETLSSSPTLGMSTPSRACSEQPGGREGTGEGATEKGLDGQRVSACLDPQWAS